MFYQASYCIIVHLKAVFPEAVGEMYSLIRREFWPGGYRDGNPFIYVITMLKVVQVLRQGRYQILTIGMGG
ncbi:MAG: hypothetical protein ABI045_01645 [Flavobacteriales bacterium]